MPASPISRVSGGAAASPGAPLPRPLEVAADHRWRTIQQEIRAAFGWDGADDRRSTLAARDRLDRGPHPWQRVARESGAWVTHGHMALSMRFGDALAVGADVDPDALEPALEGISCLVVADGSITAVRRLVDAGAPRASRWVGARPPGGRLLVTDADGPHEALIWAAEAGFDIVLHAHGHNEPAALALLDALEPVIPHRAVNLTHQLPEHIDGAHAPGGFTDGDRAVCLLRNAGWSADRVALLGYSTAHVGRWSGSTDVARTLEKLRWMERVLEMTGVRLA